MYINVLRQHDQIAQLGLVDDACFPDLSRLMSGPLPTMPRFETPAVGLGDGRGDNAFGIIASGAAEICVADVDKGFSCGCPNAFVLCVVSTTCPWPKVEAPSSAAAEFVGERVDKVMGMFVAGSAVGGKVGTGVSLRSGLLLGYEARVVSAAAFAALFMS